MSRTALVRAIATAALAIAACGPPRESAEDARAGEHDAAAAPADGSAVGVRAEDGADDSLAFEERVAVLMFADSAAFDSLRALHGEEDFYTIADDMSWYRAEAWAWLEDHGIRFVQLDGRPPLRFRVDGELRPFTPPESEWLDMVVLYDPPHEPLTLATVDVSMRAGEYFGVE